MSSPPREYSEPDGALRHRESKNVPYWLENIDNKVTPAVRKLLQEYSRIPADKVLEHVYAIREKAWKIRSYPCTGLGLWLVPSMDKCAAYDEVVGRLRAGQRFMDIGAFLGTDLRHLASIGIPTEKLYAVDIVSHWDVGYELFNDRDRFSAHFILDDALKPGPALKALEGTIDVIWIQAVLHQWDIPVQIACLRNLVALSNASSAGGALVAGFQVGTVGGRRVSPDDGEEVAKNSLATYYCHSPETWKAVWEKVGEETGTKWEVQCELRDWESMGFKTEECRYLGDDAGFLGFVARRIG